MRSSSARGRRLCSGLWQPPTVPGPSSSRRRRPESSWRLRRSWRPESSWRSQSGEGGSGPRLRSWSAWLRGGHASAEGPGTPRGSSQAAAAGHVSCHVPECTACRHLSSSRGQYFVKNCIGKYYVTYILENFMPLYIVYSVI